MPAIGLRYAMFAPITAETPNAMPTYGALIENNQATTAAIAWARSDSKFHSDDVVTESDNSVTGGVLTMGLGYLKRMFETSALGVLDKTDYLEDTDQVGRPGGFGYLRVLREGGVDYYEPNWIYKIQFGHPDESTNTRGESIEWQVPTVTGNIMGIRNDNSGMSKFRRREKFPTEAEALAFLRAMAAPEAS